MTRKPSIPASVESDEAEKVLTLASESTIMLKGINNVFSESMNVCEKDATTESSMLIQNDKAQSPELAEVLECEDSTSDMDITTPRALKNEFMDIDGDLSGRQITPESRLLE